MAKLNISMMRAYDVLKAPMVTEKSVSGAQFSQYGFYVDMKATKPEIKSAVEQIFKVKVAAVNTVVQQGKSKRFRGREGVRSDFKKAYVTLAKGETLDTEAGV